MNRKRWTALLVSAAFLIAGAYYFIARPPLSGPVAERRADNDRATSSQMSAHGSHAHVESETGHHDHESHAKEGASSRKARPGEAEAYGLHNTGARRISTYHRIMMMEGFDKISGIDTHGSFYAQGDIEKFYRDFKDVQEAIARLKEGEIDQSDLEALIEEKEHHGDWMAYLRVYAKKEIGLPLSVEEQSYFGGSNFELRRLFGEHWKEHNLKEEISKGLLPIRNFRFWAEKQALAEYKHLDQRYSELADEQLEWDVDRFEHAKGVQERIDAVYGYFFTALSEMPSDSPLFDYFDPRPEAASSVSPTPASVETVGHEALPPGPSVQIDAPPAPEIASAPLSPAEMEAQTIEAMERYGVEKGLRQIAEAHPDWAESIVRWAEERYRRQLEDRRRRQRLDAHPPPSVLSEP